jgi:flagellar basal-body rod protein FlgF
MMKNPNIWNTVIFFVIWACGCSAYASNIGYITLSNQVARKTELNVVANNVANVKTPGYEMDGVVFSPINKKATNRKDNSFVYSDGFYSAEGLGPLQRTGNPLDIAIEGGGYFKILTPNGPRYTLNGSMVISQDNVLVNAYGAPYAGRDNAPILLPEQIGSLEINQNGVIYINDEEVGSIGVFTFPQKFSLVKEGNNVYYSKTGDILVEDPRIISGSIRGSNVNSAKSMTELIELERAVSTTNSLMSDINNLERSAISKMTNVR